MKLKHENSNSFVQKTRIVFVLLALLPFLIVLYVCVYEHIVLTEEITLFFALALFSILTGFSLLRMFADKLADLSREINNIASGEKSDPIQIEADQELNNIAANFNSIQKKLKEVNNNLKKQSVQLMTYSRDLSLAYEKAKEEERLRRTLSKYVGENLIERLINSKDEMFLENERREVTILFADIRSFSIISKNMEAEEVVLMLNEFFSIMTDIVFRNNGVLDKFVGDQIMAVFGLAPSENSGPYDAVKTSIEMQDATEELMKVRSKKRKETFGIGIGINTGNAIVGNVGSENRIDFTVIGDSVNIAARLEQVAKGGEIIIGEETYHQTQSHFHTQKKKEISVKNMAEPVVCYNVLWKDHRYRENLLRKPRTVKTQDGQSLSEKI